MDPNQEAFFNLDNITFIHLFIFVLVRSHIDSNFEIVSNLPLFYGQLVQVLNSYDKDNVEDGMEPEPTDQGISFINMNIYISKYFL